MKINQPVYLQLADHFRDKINQGDFGFGDSIPSEREIAEQYGVNRMTVRKALDLLVSDGLLVRIQGKGTFVHTAKVVSDMRTIQGFSEFLTKEGFSVSSNVLSTGTRPARRKFARIFSIAEDARVHEAIRLRLADGAPMVLEYIYNPVGIIRGQENYDLKVYSMYDIYRENNINIVADHQKLEVVTVVNPQAKLLGVPERSNVFLLTSFSVDDKGRAVEYTRSYHSGEKFTYSSILTTGGAT